MLQNSFGIAVRTTMKLLYMLLLLTIIGNQIDVAIGKTGCYSFETGTDGWELYMGPFFWKWSGSSQPDISNIPSFYDKTGNYMWFQDQATPPAEGAMRSDPSSILTLYLGDRVTATIWRTILVGKENDTARPVLRFVTGSTVQNVLFAAAYNKWETVTVTCSTTDSPAARTAVCCKEGVYPCSGYFQVEGQVYIRDELLVFDELEVNDDCTTPPPSDCRCDFETSDLCDWSPSRITTGWIWSGDFPTYQIPTPPTYSQFIYIIDTSSEAFSAKITGVDNSLTTFTINYYLTEVTGSANRMEVYFRTTGGYTVHFTPDPPALSYWSTISFSCASVGCCGGVASCDGAFYVETLDYVGEMQHAAIDSFDITGPGVCSDIPPPPLVDCSCNFNTINVCGWSPSIITTGWLWSGTFPTGMIPSPPTASPFVYIIDTSAYAQSTLITGVQTGLTSFTLNYYFNTVTTVVPNNIEVYFITTTGIRTYFSTGLPLAPSWLSATFKCSDVNCCGLGVATCDGTFYVATVNSVGTFLHAAIDDFSVHGAGICSY